MSAQQRSALFIDGANLYAATKALGFDIDYRRLLKEFQSRDNLLRAFYYTAIVEDQEYSSIRPLIDWLDYNGFRVVTKPAKEFVDSMGRRKVKGNMDIELAIDALELAPRIDHMVLFSGDGDFRSLVEAMQRRGVRVTVVSTIQTQPAMIADDLRRQADEFVDLAQLIPRIGRDPGERTGGRAPDSRNPDVRSQDTRSQDSRSQDSRSQDNRGSGDTGTRSRGETPERSARPVPAAALESRYGIRQSDEPVES
ncbi:NYN domain-containing protein [Methylobacterium sp. Leaf117]|uniref:LabA-like NYN domain-containing protein n=1 Tax=Methylobacterium sp. Leaf117 TaxID=1736260 RepID=UPI0006FC8FBB|nr:NYN domain-containing protein [Methylobacterium sp. Leaf117]KQP96435.1 labA-like protein [Methylobacterium sp. Leaf117]